MLPALALVAALATADSTTTPPASPALPATPAESWVPTVTAATPIKVGGYVQFRSVGQARVGMTNSINRARIGVEGALPQRMSYRILVEYESAVGATTAATVALRDAYVRWTRAPIAITAGQYKTPFSRQYITSITQIETADRATVVDTLAPKRDVGIMAEYTPRQLLVLSAGVFNGEGQNATANRDSTVLVVARAVLHPLGGIDLGANGAWNGERSQRYGLEASLERRGALVRAEWIGQRRPGAIPDDYGWFVLGAYRVVPWLQLKVQQEDFQRPAVSAKRRMGATTAGANLDLPGGRNRVILEYSAHRTGSPFVTKDQVLAQWQVRFF
jgi:phosphate-selective porin